MLPAASLAGVHAVLPAPPHRDPWTTQGRLAWGPWRHQETGHSREFQRMACRQNLEADALARTQFLGDLGQVTSTPLFRL